MSKEKPVIPVFGPYFNGNFGDDLMGHLIATCLDAAGYEPRLWRGPNNSFRGRSWNTASNMDDLVAGAKCVIFGGGLPFCNSDFTPYWEAMSDMVDACESRDIPLIAISVGSHGHHEDLHPSAIKLVESPIFKSASLRLKCDVEWLRSKGKDVEYIPDIVLTAMPYSKRKALKNVLLCISVGDWERPLIDWVVGRLRKRSIEVATVGQFADGFPRSEDYYHGKHTKVANSGPDDVAQAIETADLVVATGLHIGIVALASGAEFIGYRAAGKTRTFMGQCGRQEQVVVPGNKVERLFSFWSLYDAIINISPIRNEDKVHEMVEAANGHFRFMMSQIERIQK